MTFNLVINACPDWPPTCDTQPTVDELECFGQAAEDSWMSRCILIIRKPQTSAPRSAHGYLPIGGEEQIETACSIITVTTRENTPSGQTPVTTTRIKISLRFDPTLLDQVKVTQRWMQPLPHAEVYRITGFERGLSAWILDVEKVGQGDRQDA